MAKTLTTRVVKAISLLGSSQGLNMVCSVVRMKVLSLLVGPIGVGLIGALTQAVEMTSSVTQLNMRTTAVRDLASAPEGRFNAVLVCVRRYGRILGLLGAILLFLAAPLLSRFTFASDEYATAYRIASLAVLFNALQGNEYILLQSVQRYAAIAATGLFGAVAGLAVAIPLYWFFGLEGVAPSIVVYTLMAWGAALWLSRGYRIQGEKPTWSESLKMGRGFIAVGALLTVTNFACEAVNLLMVSYMGRQGDSTLGLFQAGYTIVWRYTGYFFSAFTVEFYPRISRLSATPRRMRPMLSHQSIVAGLMFLPCAAVIILLAPWLLRLLYSSEFISATPYVVWGMVAMSIRPFTATVSYAFLAANKGRIYALSEIGTSVLGLALNIAGYRLGGFAGLGVAAIAWMALELIFITGIARMCQLPIPSRRALMITAGSASLLAALAGIMTAF